ncbi:MAG: SDR family oxidoreductase [Gemmatimonadales bacterium]
MTGPSDVAIITGAASGIGRHWAGALQRRRGCYKLVLADVNASGLRASFEPGDDVVLHTLDVRSVAGWRALVADTMERFGRIDYLFNIAGGARPGF